MGLALHSDPSARGPQKCHPDSQWPRRSVAPMVSGPDGQWPRWSAARGLTSPLVHDAQRPHCYCTAPGLLVH